MNIRLQFAALLLLGTLPCTACAQPADPEQTKQQPAADSAEQPDEAAPAPAARVLNVKYDGTKLTVTAKQVKLGELLEAITAKTGVVFDLPDSLASVKITAQAGPAGLRDALVALLKKPPVDYAMAGDPDQPGEVERIVILARGEKAGAAESAAAETEQARPDAPEGPWPDAYQTEERLIREARESEKAREAEASARKAQENTDQKQADVKTIDPTENGAPRNYESGLSETEATMTPDELYRHWLRAREEQQRKLREAQGAGSPH